MAKTIVARTFRIHGRVQGVGFRYFVKKHADAIGLRGFVRNEDDGCVFVYAIGDRISIERINELVRLGPPYSEVRHVEVKDAEVTEYRSFHFERSSGR